MPNLQSDDPLIINLQNQLKESKHRFQILFENAPIAFHELDFSKIKSYFDNLKLDTDLESYLNNNTAELINLYDMIPTTNYNRRYLEMHEVDPSNIFRRPGKDALIDESAQAWKDIMVKWYNGEDSFTVESKVKTYTGKLKNILRIYTVIPDEENTRTRILGSFMHITDLKLAEEAVRRSERKYRDLVETSQNLIWRCDVLGRYTYLNPSWEQTHGYRLDEMIGKRFTEFQTPEVAKRDMREFTKYLEGGREENFKTTQITKSGKEIDLVFTTMPIKNDKGEIIGTQGTAIDITDRLLAEQALKDSELRYRTLVDNAPEAIVIVDVNTHRFVQVNDAAIDLFKISNKEFLESTISDLSPEIQPDGRSTVEVAEEAIDIALSGNPVIFEWVHKNGEGIEFPCEIRLIKFPSLSENLVRASIVDISIRKKTEQELQTTREQLFQAQKMEAVGRLAGGIAHDFNNMLTLITLNVEILASKVSSDDKKYTNLQNILSAVTSATKLTSELLLFSRDRKMNPEIVNVNEILEKQLLTLKPLLTKNITQLSNFDPLAGNIYIDSNNLEQMILNLVINAVDAMPQGGTLTVETKYVPENYVSFEGKYNTEQLVEITVKDTGVGMTEEVKQKIFEPFFSTKTEHKGTGLGLSTIYHIIQQNNGYIKFESKESDGTAFYIYLPKRDPLDLRAQRDFESTLEVIDRTDQILLIDDDVKIRTIIREILTMGGFEVLDAGNASDALRIFTENMDDIKLVITDVVMPDIYGLDLVNQIIQIKSSVKVLYITGDADKFDTISNNLTENMDRLLKPFNSDTLINKLMDLVD